eukprot:Amastigsp_a849850_21.p3 type:complete len:107 gc:universal Amastigsp_a849850_21:286-606(+)
MPDTHRNSTAKWKPCIRMLRTNERSATAASWRCAREPTAMPTPSTATCPNALSRRARSSNLVAPSASTMRMTRPRATWTPCRTAPPLPRFCPSSTSRTTSEPYCCM